MRWVRRHVGRVVTEAAERDSVNHPTHYNQVPGVECLDVVRWFPFFRGNAVKYVWRRGLKGAAVADLRKAIFYVEAEIADLTAEPPSRFRRWLPVRRTRRVRLDPRLVDLLDKAEGHFSGNQLEALRCLCRAGTKGDTATDLREAIAYIEAEIADLLAEAPQS